MKKSIDAINPDHYNSRSCQCIYFTRNLSFTAGNAFKYAWRLGMKDDEQQENKKINWYMSDLYEHRMENIKAKHLQDSEKTIMCLVSDLLQMRDEFSEYTHSLLVSLLMAESGFFDNFFMKRLNNVDFN